jgi:RHS repeat-associated protein
MSRNLFKCGGHIVVSFLVIWFCSTTDLGQAQTSFGHDMDGVNYEPRESGLSGFENIDRQFDVGPGGDLTYSIPLMSLPGSIPMDLNLIYTSGIKVDQSATWVGLGWSIGEYAVRRITISGDDAYVKASASAKCNDTYEVTIPGRSLKFFNYGDERDPRFAPMSYSADSLYCSPYRVDHPDWSTEDDPSDQDKFVLFTPDGTRYIFNYVLKRAARDWDIPPEISGLTENEDGIRYRINYMWLLTAILSPDYVDGSPTPDDNPLNSVSSNKGYWIAFTYSWNNSEATESYLHPQDAKFMALYGQWDANGSGNYHDTTEVTYPFRIITPTHVLQFMTEPKPGVNYRCLRSGPAFYNNLCEEGCGLFCGRIKDRMLKAIRLYQYSGAGSTPQGDVLNEYRFLYEEGVSPYNDLKIWENGDFGGDLTLKEVYQTGADSFYVGSNAADYPPHPYKFTYGYNPMLSNTSPGADNYDWWFNGICGVNGNKQASSWNVPTFWYRDFFGYYDANGTDTLEQTAWQLTEVEIPTGSRIKFEWQTDSYKRYEPAFGTTMEFRNNGGTRIRRIITYKDWYSGQNNPADTITYEYGLNGDGFGYPTSMPSVYFKWLHHYEPCVWTVWHFNSDNGEHTIQYPLISETYQSNGIKGKKETYYTTREDVGPDQLRTHIWIAYPYQIHCYNGQDGFLEHAVNIYWDRTPLMGLPYKSVVKDKDGNIISTENQYFSYIVKNAYIGSQSSYWAGDTLGGSYFVQLDSTVTIKDGVKYKTSNQYNEFGMLASRKEHGTGSVNSSNRITTYEYAYAAYPSMKEKRMLGQIYRKKVLEEVNQNQYLRSQDSTVWSENQHLGRWYPSSIYQWKDVNYSVTVDPQEEILVKSLDSYDDFGNLVQWSDANGTKHITKFGNNRLAIVEASNASKDELFYNDFEQGISFDGWSLNSGTLVSDTLYTGQKSLGLQSTGSEVKGASHTNNAPLARKYLFTGWVRCSQAGRAKLALKVNGGAPIEVIHTGSGKWELLKVSTAISQGSQLEGYVAVGSGAGTAAAYFDELRLSPDTALVASRVFDAAFNVIATSDENSLTSRNVYDGQQRLIARTDQIGSPVHGLAYSYSINRLECIPDPYDVCTYNEGEPNSMVEISGIGKGYLDDYSSNTLGDYQKSASPPPIFRSTKKRVELPYNSWMKLPYTSLSNFDVSFDFVKTPWRPGTQENDTYGLLQLTLYVPGGSYYKCMIGKYVGNPYYKPYIWLVKSTAPNVPMDSFPFSIVTPSNPFIDLSVIFNIHLVKVDQRLYIFLNGEPVIYSMDASPLTNFEAIEIVSNCDTFYVDNLIIRDNVRLTRHFYNGLGQKFQTMRDDGQNTYTTETVFDIYGRPALVTKEAFKANDYLTCMAGMVNEAVTWQLGDPMTTASYVNSYYSDCGNYPYIYSKLLPDPDGRPLEQSFPGYDYRPVSGHTISCVYRAGTDNEIVGYPVGTLGVTRKQDENGNYVYNYFDQFGNLVAVKVDSAGLNLVTKFQYDMLGNRIFETSPNQYSTSYWYNTLSQQVFKYSVDNDTTHYEYDLNGSLKYTQDGNQQQSGQFTARNYDAFNRLIQEGTEKNQTYTFTLTNRPPLSNNYGTDANEWRIKRYYDLDYMNSPPNYCKGKLTKEEANWDDDNTAEYIAKYKYDEKGNLIEQRVTLDGLSEKIVTFHYNSQGQLDTIYYPDGSKVSYVYDNLGRLRNVGNGTAVSRYASYTYKPGGLMESDTLKNASGGIVQILNYSYTTRDWLFKLNDGQASSEVSGTGDRYGLTVSYTNGGRGYNGNIAKAAWQFSPAGSSDSYVFDYFYDKANRLILSEDFVSSAYDESCYYDGNGNLTNLKRGGTAHIYNYYPNTNRLKYVTNWGQGSTNYHYDNNGNMTRDGLKALDTATYDYTNLLTHAEITWMADSDKLDFYYDTGGNRVKKWYQRHYQTYYSCCYCGNPDSPIGGVGDESQEIQPDGVCSFPCYWGTCAADHADTSITYYIYHGSNILAEYTKNGTLKSKFIYANGERIARDTSGTVYYYLKDHLGSTRAMVDQNGVILARYNYYAYGEEMNSIITVGTDYKYTGKEYDEESGLNLYYYGARYYDAKMGRFISADPFAEKYPSWSPYVYTLDNPIKHIDPDGKEVRFANGASSIFKQQFAQAVKYLNAHKASGMLARLHASNTVYYIKEGSIFSKYNANQRTISWDSKMGIITTEKVLLSPTTVLNHEIDHALQHDENPGKYVQDVKTEDAQYGNKEEKRVIEGSEQKTARKLGETQTGQVTRKDHKGVLYETTEPTSTEAKNAIIVTPERKENKEKEPK